MAMYPGMEPWIDYNNEVGDYGSRSVKATRGKRKERCYTCEYCAKVFHKKGNWQVHLRTHTKEKPFTCIDCGRQFTQKSNMKRHRQKIHGVPSATAGETAETLAAATNGHPSSGSTNQNSVKKSMAEASQSSTSTSKTPTSTTAHASKGSSAGGSKPGSVTSSNPGTPIPPPVPNVAQPPLLNSLPTLPPPTPGDFAGEGAEGPEGRAAAAAAEGEDEATGVGVPENAAMSTTVTSTMDVKDPAHSGSSALGTKRQAEDTLDQPRGPSVVKRRLNASSPSLRSPSPKLTGLLLSTGTGPVAMKGQISSPTPPLHGGAVPGKEDDLGSVSLWWN